MAHHTAPALFERTAPAPPHCRGEFPPTEAEFQTRRHAPPASRQTERGHRGRQARHPARHDRSNQAHRRRSCPTRATGGGEANAPPQTERSFGRRLPPPSGNGGRGKSPINKFSGIFFLLTLCPRKGGLQSAQRRPPAKPRADGWKRDAKKSDAFARPPAAAAARASTWRITQGRELFERTPPEFERCRGEFPQPRLPPPPKGPCARGGGWRAFQMAHPSVGRWQPPPLIPAAGKTKNSDKQHRDPAGGGRSNGELAGARKEGGAHRAGQFHMIKQRRPPRA